MATWAIVIHGGAGVISKDMPKERVKPYTEALAECIKIGGNILRSNGTATDAVEACIRYMEDCELFNAGKGAVLNRNGECELDASIMIGNTLQCGAVSATKIVKNPISLARSVMEKTPHILLTADGADNFAIEMKHETVPQFYFFTQRRHEQWVEAQKENKVQLDHSTMKEDAKGTVGCVALDSFGNLVAGTSTGGMTNKMPGRVGDSPLIGAGNYANHLCAISATGTGEQMIRHCVTRDIAALMEYKGISLKEASETVVFKKLNPDDGGIIGVDKDGNIAMIFNSLGMFRACENSQGLFDVKIWE